ncbi:MAG: membrane protein insertase YidC [Alphaproteobacteria bacterium]
MLNNKDQMHPHDIRNIIIFGIVSIILWTLFEVYVLQPKKEAIQKRQQIERLIAEKEAETGQEIIPRTLVRPRNEVLAEERRITFSNNEITGTINTKGGRIDDLSLDHFYQTLAKENKVTLLSPKDTQHPRFVDYGWVAKDKTVKLPDNNTIWQVRGNEQLTLDNPITLVWNNDQGLIFERIISLDEHYMFEITQRVINDSGRDIQLFPYALITQTGLPKNLQNIWIMHEGPIGFIGQELMQSSYSDLREKGRREKTADQGWIGITDKYWLTSVIPPQGQNAKYRFNHVQNFKEPDKGRFQIDYTGTAVTIPAGSSGQSTSHLFAGAKEVLLLNEYEEALNIPNFNLSVDFGWFWFMTKPFFYALHYIFEFVGNMGIAIIILTIIIRTMVFPLTNTSYRSFAKMKKVAPQISELRDTYGDNKQRLQQEIVELYSREGVNPMAGCLPILIQIPIFFSLYKVFFVTIEMRHAPFFGWIKDLSAPDPTSIFNLFGLLPYDVPAFLMIGVWPCLMLLGMLLQKKLNPPPQDKFQRDLMNIFPFFIAYIMSGFASGLVIYWTFSAYIGILQQMIIMRSLGVPIYLFGQSEEEEKLEKQVQEGPDVYPLSEMAEEDFEEAMFGNHGEDKSKEITPPKPKKSKKKKK